MRSRITVRSSLESLEIQIDSVVVQVLTRDVALASWPHHFRRVLKDGSQDEAKGNIFDAWLRTEEGWKSTSGFSYYATSIR